MEAWRDRELNDELCELILALPESERILARLKWSFYRAAEPQCAKEDKDEQFALHRFIAWAFFMARPHRGPTLAERALRRARDLAPDRRRLLTARAAVRCSVWMAESVDHDVIVLRDQFTRARVRVIRGEVTLDCGQGVLGTLLPTGENGLFGFGPGTVVLQTQELPEPPHRVSEDASSTALIFEEQAYGATTAWIQQLDEPAWQEAYRAFADALRPYETLPSAEAMRAVIIGHETPAKLRKLVRRHKWWFEQEEDVFRAFQTRLWNLTPCARLGGITPAEHAARVGACGPEEIRLLQLAVEELQHAIDGNQSVDALNAQATEFIHRWMNTPRADLEGMTPHAVIGRERAQRATMRN